MVYAKSDIIDGLRRFKEQNGEKYGILALGLYGSYARDEQHPGSDIDVAVLLIRPSFFNLIPMEEEMRRSIAKEINLISLGLSRDSKFRQSIEKDIVYV